VSDGNEEGRKSLSSGLNSSRCLRLETRPRRRPADSVLPFGDQVAEDRVDHCRVEDEGDDSHFAAAARAHQRVDLAHPLDRFASAVAQGLRLPKAIDESCRKGGRGTAPRERRIECHSL
jgi:hypothetical protein